MIGLWLVFLGFFTIVILSATRFGANLTLNIVHSRSLKWVLGVYTVILLLAVAVLYLLPRSGFLPSAVNSPDLFSKIYDAAQKGKLDQTKGIDAKRKWSFTYSGSRLGIINEPNTTILSRRKTSDDGKIDVEYFASQGIADGIAFSDMIQPPSIVLKDSKLMITNPVPYSINLARFEPDFTVSRFSIAGTDRNIMEQGGFASASGLIVLQIPNDLKLDAQNNLEIVQNKPVEFTEQQYLREPDFARILPYKNKYMGNASNLANLFHALPLNNSSMSFQLFPDTLSVNVNYRVPVKSIGEDKVNAALIYNATAAFALIDNLEAIDFKFTRVSFTVLRSEVEKWYGVKLATLTDTETWQNTVQRKLNNYDYDYIVRCSKAILHKHSTD